MIIKADMILIKIYSFDFVTGTVRHFFILKAKVLVLSSRLWESVSHIKYIFNYNIGCTGKELIKSIF